MTSNASCLKKVGIVFATAVALTLLGTAETGFAQSSAPPCNTEFLLPNTFFGTGAGVSITTGCDNSGFGFNALNAESTGVANTAVGAAALEKSDVSEGNTAVGFAALQNENSSGGGNVAVGVDALNQDTTGAGNVGIGSGALSETTIGMKNTSLGDAALAKNTTGNNNVAVGELALQQLTTGANDIALGPLAGVNLTGSESGDIDIGNPGAAGDRDTIRVGVQGFCGGVLPPCPRTFIAGIVGNPMSKSSASTVLIDGNGQLGVQVSSARYKRDIRDMGSSSAKLMRLRPVSFRYKQDPDGSVQYGLIAEEVAPVYPELVTRGADGKVQGVRYDLLPAMLLNEVQKQARDNRRKDAQIEALTERLNALEHEVRASRPERVAAMR
jgi:Chaperone of endosialidase